MEKLYFDPAIGEWVWSAMPDLPEGFDEPVLALWEMMDWGDIYPR